MRKLGATTLFVLAGALVLVGTLFLIAAASKPSRLLSGGVLLALGIAFGLAGRRLLGVPHAADEGGRIDERAARDAEARATAMPKVERLQYFSLVGELSAEDGARHERFKATYRKMVASLHELERGPWAESARAIAEDAASIGTSLLELLKKSALVRASLADTDLAAIEARRDELAKRFDDGQQLDELDELQRQRETLESQLEHHRRAAENLERMQATADECLELLTATELRLTHLVSADALIEDGVLTEVSRQVKQLGQRIDAQVEAVAELSQI